MNSKNYWLKVGVATVVLAFLANVAAKWLLTPADDGNLSAYKVLVAGAQSGRYDSMRDCAAVACRTANDESLKKCADYLSRVSDLAIRSGCRTFQEANSFSGFVKGFISGFLNPLMGIESAALLVEGWFNKSDFERIDAVYLPLWQKEAFASKAAFWIAVVVFFALPILAHKKRGRITEWLDSREKPNQAPDATR